MDMDHCAADNDGENEWNNNATTPWKLLTRGYHQCIYDHDYWKPGTNRAIWEKARRNIGLAAAVASEMDLAAMDPRNDLSSSGYCLANAGQQYLVFQPGEGPLTVKGLLAGSKYHFRWYNIAQARVAGRGTLQAADSARQFDTPFENAVLYLVRAANTR